MLPISTIFVLELFRCRIVNIPPRNICYIVNIPPGKNYYIANIPPSMADRPPDILLHSKCSPLIRIITIDSEFSTLIVLILIVIYH